MILEGDCVEAMAAMGESSVDAIVTDPPYGLGFMGKQWDHLSPGIEFAHQALRVLKPGGHLLAFGGTRTYHRLACAIEDAGLEIRDTLCWLYGSGFPKSHNLPDGRGTALKPAHEPVVVARKPLVGTVAGNVQAFGTGALNIDATRVEATEGDHAHPGDENRAHTTTAYGCHEAEGRQAPPHDLGRWPANVILDEESSRLLDEQTGEQRDGVAVNRNRGTMNSWLGTRSVPTGPDVGYGGSGGASRYFYCAKSSSGERNAGLDGFEYNGMTSDGYGSIQTPKLDRAAPRENWTPREVRNPHPTVKPIALMRWLVRLVTPPGGTVLDPFLGSGTTGCAAALEGFDFIGIEREAEYVELARARIAHWTAVAEEAARPPAQMELA